MDELKKRKDIRLKGFDYSKTGSYFITICTQDRKNLFWNGGIDTEKFKWVYEGYNRVRPKNLPLSSIGNTVLEELEKWNDSYDTVSLHTYVIMPNHIHLMVIIYADECGRPQEAPAIDRMVKQFKGAVTKKLGISIWQKSYIDHVIRNKDDFETRVKYIYENPIRWFYDEMYSEV